MSTRTRFEKEAKGNWEMACCNYCALFDATLRDVATPKPVVGRSRTSRALK